MPLNLSTCENGTVIKDCSDANVPKEYTRSAIEREYRRFRDIGQTMDFFAMQNPDRTISSIGCIHRLSPRP